ncbi:fimbrial protein [Citrobacter amalonaticus]|uniref:fimbrial protein n=1 Tax=Citrobacter amalonaticus TaxID=35703 RepID=UPI00300C2567
MNLSNILKFFIITLLFSVKVMAACNNNISTYTKTVSFGNVIVQRDTAPGTVVATQAVNAPVNFSCGGAGPYLYQESMRTSLTSYGNNIYEIGVPGFGIRVSENGTDGTLHHYFPISINGWTNGSGTNQTNLYKFELVKTSAISSSGNLRVGTIADTAMYNQFYIGYFNVGGGTIQVVQCNINTPNLNFPIGNISASSFGSTVGTTPSGAQNTQNLGLNCDAGTNINVSFTGTQNPDVGTTSVLALTGQGNTDVAKGVGVQILYNGSPLVLNNRIVLKQSSGGQETFPLTARYYQTKTSVTPGTANASATLNLTYQ